MTIHIQTHSRLPLVCRQVNNPHDLDQTAVSVATAAEQYAGYASSEKHAVLQSCVAAINAVVDAKICEATGDTALQTGSKEIVSVVDPLLSTTEGLIIRPAASVSAFVCLSTAHKLVMMLGVVEVPNDFEPTRREWARRVKELGKHNAKWARLSVPESLVKLVWTQLQLAINAVPDPKVR